MCDMYKICAFCTYAFCFEILYIGCFYEKNKIILKMILITKHCFLFQCLIVRIID